MTLLDASHHEDQLSEDVLLTVKEYAEWLSVSNVAKRLSVSPWQVRKWIDAGQFDEIAVFSKRLTRISAPAFQRFVQKNRRLAV